jgi:hypothetical protein
VFQGFSGGKAAAAVVNGGLMAIAGKLFLKVAKKEFLDPNDLISFSKLHRFASDRCRILDQHGQVNVDDYATRQRLITEVLRFAEESLRGWLPGSHFELCVFVDREQPLLLSYFDSNHASTARSMNERAQNPNWYVEKNYEVLKVLAEPTSHPRILQDTEAKKNSYTFTSPQQCKQLRSTMLWCIDVGAPCAIVVSSNEKNAFRESDPEVSAFIKFIGNLARFDLLERRFIYRIRELRPDLFSPTATNRPENSC